MFNVLSLFDGISCGMIALNRCGIPIDNYYASEIDDNAIKVSNHHFPNIIRLGDVSSIDSNLLPRIDLLIGGFPCQSFSFAGKELNFNDPRGSLFFQYVRLLNDIKPRYFLAENVVMQEKFSDKISEMLGVKCIKLNSLSVSAQSRKRLYWTNIPINGFPSDRGINLIDILDRDEFYLKHYPNLRNGTIVGSRRIGTDGKRDDYNTSIPRIQTLEVRNVNINKTNCITTVAKDNVLTPHEVGRHKDAFGGDILYRNYTPNELCRLQTIPDNYFNGVVSDGKVIKMVGNAWTVDIISWLLNQIPKVSI